MSENYPPYPSKLAVGGAGGAGPASGTQPYYPPNPGGATSSSGGVRPWETPAGFNRQKFVESYAKMVARTWTDPSYLDLLVADPVPTLAAAGMPVTEGAVVRIVQMKITGQGAMEDQIQAWLLGLTTGRFDVYVPIIPDEIDLPDDGSGGEGDIGCCCTPCCCCT